MLAFLSLSKSIILPPEKLIYVVELLPLVLTKSVQQ